MVLAVEPVLDYTIVRISIVFKAPQIRITQNVETLILVILVFFFKEKLIIIGTSKLFTLPYLFYALVLFLFELHIRWGEVIIFSLLRASQRRRSLRP